MPKRNLTDIQQVFNPLTLYKMTTINTVQKIFDEMAVFSEISKDIPPPYNVILNKKIFSINAYLSKILTLETDFQNSEKQNLTSDLLTGLERQQFEK